MRRLILAALMVFFVTLAACGKDSDNPPPAGTPATSGPDQGTLSPVLIALQSDYESLVESYRAISDIWEGLAEGQSVQCGSYPSVPNPDSIRADGDGAYEPLADALRRAAIDLDHAANLWKAECSQARPTPPPAIINEGRLAARAAGDALKEAEPLLGGIQ